MRRNFFEKKDQKLMAHWSKLRDVFFWTKDLPLDDSFGINPNSLYVRPPRKIGRLWLEMPHDETGHTKAYIYIKQAEKFALSNDPFLVVSGASYFGKTTFGWLASLITMRAHDHGDMFFHTTQIKLDLLSSRVDEEKHNYIKSCIKSDALFLDELGTTGLTDINAKLIQHIIDSRMDKKTIICTNNDLKEYPEPLTNRLADCFRINLVSKAHHYQMPNAVDEDFGEES